MKVKPKLKFEVGEKVVICDCISFMNNTKCYPDKDDFTFTTIKEVKEDGSVVVEEGYRYRQAYETTYGETEVFDYFRIDVAKLVNINNKEYTINGIRDVALFYGGPTFLFKMSKSFEDKVIKCEIRNQERLRTEELAEAKRLKEKPFKDAYEQELKPFEEKYYKMKSLLFKKHFCANCKFNKNNNCTQWNYDLESSQVDTCWAWEVE